jgi:hypothetical protein
VADRQVALPCGVGRVGGGQPLGDVEGGLVVGAGGGQVPGRLCHVPKPLVADRQVALPFGVGGVGSDVSLDLLVDGVELAGGGGQVPGVEEGLNFQVRRRGG